MRTVKPFDAGINPSGAMMAGLRSLVMSLTMRPLYPDATKVPAMVAFFP